jgi:probable rRNA maturation factor
MPSPPIHFHSLVPTGFLRNRTKLKRFISSIFKEEGKKISFVSYIFCSDEYLLSINQEYLKHDELTDTISFTFSEKREPVVGEVYISIERIKENAIIFNCTAGKELHRVVFHSTLHLCGHRDDSKQMKDKIRRLEDKLLISYFGS